MIYPKLQAGDVFCTRYPGSLGWAITLIESLYEDDGSGAEYSHAGLFQGPTLTFESLSTVLSREFPKDFLGAKMLIGRHERMDSFAFNYGFELTNKHWGDIYPYHRLGMHLLGIANISFLDMHVCSELVSEFLWNCGLLEEWRGKTPDDIADMIKGGKPWDVILEETIVGA